MRSEKEGPRPTEKKGLRSTVPGRKRGVNFDRMLRGENIKRRIKRAGGSLSDFISKLPMGDRQTSHEYEYKEMRCSCDLFHGGADMRKRQAWKKDKMLGGV